MVTDKDTKQFSTGYKHDTVDKSTGSEISLLVCKSWPHHLLAFWLGQVTWAFCALVPSSKIEDKITYLQGLLQNWLS